MRRLASALTIAIAVTSLASCSSSSTSSDATDGSAVDARTPTSDGETAEDRQGWVATRRSPSGTSTLVVTSTDGLSWQPAGTSDALLHDLVQGPDGWIAVDTGESGTTTVYASADLRSWDPVATLDGAVRALAFGDGRFVAIGWESDRTGPQRPKAHWSDDGTTWTTVDLPDGLFLANTPFDLSGGLVHTGTEFVAVQTGPVPGGGDVVDLRSVVRRYRSTDGITWTLEEGSDLLAGGSRVALAPGPDPGSLVQAVEVLGDDTEGRDTDGDVTAPPATDAVTIIGADGATLERGEPDVALAEHPADEIAYDGSTYLVLSTGPAGYNGDTPGPDVYRSADGLTYEHLGQLTGHLGNVAHGTIGPAPTRTGEGGWVLLDRLTDSVVMVSEVLVSTDGGGWTEVAEIAENPRGATDHVQGVGQTNTAALIQGPTGWLAFGIANRVNDVSPVTLVRWSPDLRTWSTVAQVDGHLLAAAYGDGRFVAVGTTSPDGAGRGAADLEPLAMVSTDGLAWERAELPAVDVTSLTSVTHVDDGFLAAGTGALTGTGDLTGEPTTVQSLVSSDGETWGPSPQAPRAAGGASVTVAAGDDDDVIQVAVPSDVGGTTVTGATAAPIPTALEVLSPEGTVRDSIADSPFDRGPAGASDVHQLAHGDGTFMGITANEQRTVVRTSSDGRTWDEMATLDGTVAVVVAHGYFDADAEPSQPAPETSATSTTSAPDTTVPTTAPAATSTAPPRASGSALGDEPTFHDDRASGSGCSPGAGDLPDGWWFGFARSQVSADSAFDFDLACYYTGSIGEQKAREAGVGFTGFVVTNDRTTTRPVAVSAGAVLRCVDPATQEQGPCSRPGASGFPVWVRVVGGRADKVVDQYVH